MKKVEIPGIRGDEAPPCGGRAGRSAVDRGVLLGQGVRPRSLVERLRSRMAAGGTAALDARDLAEVRSRMENLMKVCPEIGERVELSRGLGADSSRIGSPVERGLGSRGG